MLNRIIQKEEDYKHLKIKLFGIKINIRKKVKLTLEDIRCYNLAMKVNENLKKYRDIYTGKDVVIVGCGPSVKYYDTPIKNAVHIGINRAYKLEQVNFDCLFAQDKFPKVEDEEGFINYKPDTCIKFLGRHPFSFNLAMRDSFISRIRNKEIYILNCRRPEDAPIPIDISVEPFARYNGTVFSVLQFLLYANAKRIFLVGFDCNVGHAFKAKDDTTGITGNDLTGQFKYWQYFKCIINACYETAEIYSVNPVTLKGMFSDVYTQSYIDANVDLNKEQVTIIQ